MTSSVSLFDQRQSMTLDFELWAPILEAPGYLVSTDGRVRYRDFDVATWPNKKGYICVSIVLPNGKPVLRYVHRLMLLAFRAPTGPSSGPLTNHKDGRKGRNAIDNLEWTTHSGNVTHAWALRRQARYRELSMMMGSLFDSLEG
jgi:hypothetical protein